MNDMDQAMSDLNLGPLAVPMPGTAPGRSAGRILLVDDHPGFRAHLHRIMDDDPRLAVVGEASSGIEALRLIEALRPDLVIIDPHVFGLPSSDVASALRRLWPDVAIIFRAMQIDPELHLASAIVGATCLSKEAPIATLVDAVHAALRGSGSLGTLQGGDHVARWAVGPVAIDA